MPWDDPRAGRTGRGPHGSHGGHGRGAPWGSGPPPWLQGLIGLAQSGGTATRGPRVRRGDVRAAILDVLATEPMNGYQIIQQIAERSGGAWKPSPGSIYPTLQQLEDEGLVRQETEGGKRTFTLTDEGRAYVAEHTDEVTAPWQAMSEASGDDDGLKPLIGQVAAAVCAVLAA